MGGRGASSILNSRSTLKAIDSYTKSSSSISLQNKAVQVGSKMYITNGYSAIYMDKINGLEKFHDGMKEQLPKLYNNFKDNYALSDTVNINQLKAGGNIDKVIQDTKSNYGINTKELNKIQRIIGKGNVEVMHKTTKIHGMSDYVFKISGKKGTAFLLPMIKKK